MNYKIIVLFNNSLHFLFLEKTLRVNYGEFLKHNLNLTNFFQRVSFIFGKSKKLIKSFFRSLIEKNLNGP